MNTDIDGSPKNLSGISTSGRGIVLRWSYFFALAVLFIEWLKKVRFVLPYFIKPKQPDREQICRGLFVRYYPIFFLNFSSGKYGRIEVCRFMNMLKPKDSDFTAMWAIIFMVGGVFVWKSAGGCLYLHISRKESGTLLSDLIKSWKSIYPLMQMGIEPKSLCFGFILRSVSDFCSWFP